MIKNDSQRARTVAQLEGFRTALKNAQAETSGKRQAALIGSYEGMIRQLEAEIAEYDKLKKGKVQIPAIERLDQISPYIARIRIAKGVSQTELARRLGVSKQVVGRYEESDYQTLGVGKLQEVLDALGVKTQTRLTA